MLEAAMSDATVECNAPQLTIAMCGQNIVIRSTDAIGDGHARALAGAVNAAAVTGNVVVIDPAPVRCGDVFAGDEHLTPSSGCTRHDGCGPVDAEVVNGRMIRIATEFDAWTIDLRSGRFCRSSPSTHHLFVSPEAWVPVVAIIVTRTQLRAVTTEGVVITSLRANRETGVSGEPTTLSR